SRCRFADRSDGGLKILDHAHRAHCSWYIGGAPRDAIDLRLASYYGDRCVTSPESLGLPWKPMARTDRARSDDPAGASAGQSSLEVALERVGDRWSLLLVEALLDGPRRFSDLLDGLPGLAPNI